MGERLDRWAHLLACADALERAPDAELSVVLRERLGSLIEVFDAPDPVTDFEGAAVRAFASALARSADREGSGVVVETFGSVQVADMDRATAFYERALGAAVAFASPPWTSLRIAGVRLGLAHVPGHAGGATGLHFAVRQREGARARVLAAGGRIVTAALEVGPGIVIDDVADTEGNVFALVESSR